jgi:UPF0755 protein
MTSVFVGVALALLIGGGGWLIYTSPRAVPATGIVLTAAQDSDPIYITVNAGDSAPAIAKRLEAAGIIDSAGSFSLLARMTGADRRLAAGEYEFTAHTSPLDAVTRIRDGLTSARVVTIPEGLRLEQIADLMQQRGVVSANDFLAAVNATAASGTNIDADLLSSRPGGGILEGYLYPATYSFARNITAQEAVLIMLQTMSQRFTPELRAEARGQGLSVHQVLILASIVEREVVNPDERPIIASVYRNRIAVGMPLQADPTVQYAIASRPGNVAEYGYWKKELSLQDLQFDSSYNTYTRSGLPPGPIASPGIDSILAVIRPAETNYLFFVARNDGSHAFSETFEQHQRNVQLYQP